MKKLKKIKNKRKELEKEIEGLWKYYCILRDDFTCQLCGKNIKETTLQVHHILSRRHKNLKFDVENGITLCKNCHSKISLNTTASQDFLIWYIKKYGLEKIEKLREKSNEIKKYSISELESLRENLISKINELKEVKQ